MGGTRLARVSLAEPPPPGERRRAVARGAVINSGFLVALGGLNLVKAFIAASFLTQSEYGVWSVIVLAIAFTTVIKMVAVGDKYIQQDEEDQTVAFQKSFTLELISAAILVVISLVTAPLLVLIYGESELLVPAMVLSVMLLGLALQSPIWVFYRRMDFMRQRLYMAVDPVVGFVVTIALAVAGLGYWALVIGAITGSLVGGLFATLNAPIPLKLRYDGATMRTYLSFSVPLMIAAGSGMLIAQLSVLTGELALGLAGAGAIGLSGQFSNWADRADAVVTQAMYPAICRVRDRRELLQEAFTKSNRLALMWGFPFGIALALFAHDLTAHVLGPGWESAAGLLSVFGLVAAFNHMGFNWSAFFRARGETRPIAVVNVAALVVFCATAIPLLFASGLEGYAIGFAVMTATSLALRFYYLGKLFPAFQMARHMAQAIAPTVPAVASVLVLRTLTPGEGSGELALVELVTYAAVTVVATLAFERALLREVFSYVRPAPPLETGIP